MFDSFLTHFGCNSTWTTQPKPCKNVFAVSDDDDNDDDDDGDDDNDDDDDDDDDNDDDDDGQSKMDQTSTTNCQKNN